MGIKKSPEISWYNNGPAILHFFQLSKYHKIIKIKNGH